MRLMARAALILWAGSLAACSGSFGPIGTCDTTGCPVVSLSLGVEVVPMATSGFLLRDAAGVALRNCSVTWGPSPPDFFQYALDAQGCPGLDASGLSGTAAHPGVPAQLVNILHPAGSELNVAHAIRSKIDAFGIQYEGNAAFSRSPFSWSG